MTIVAYNSCGVCCIDNDTEHYLLYDVVHDSIRAEIPKSIDRFFVDALIVKWHFASCDRKVKSLADLRELHSTGGLNWQNNGNELISLVSKAALASS